MAGVGRYGTFLKKGNYAIKNIYEGNQRARKELELLKKIDHNRILKLGFTSPKGNRVCLVME